MKPVVGVTLTIGLWATLAFFSFGAAKVDTLEMAGVLGGKNVCYDNGEFECPDPPTDNCGDQECDPITENGQTVYYCPVGHKEPSVPRDSFDSCVEGGTVYMENGLDGEDWCWKWRLCLSECEMHSSLEHFCKRGTAGGDINAELGGVYPHHSCNETQKAPKGFCKIDPL